MKVYHSLAEVPKQPAGTSVAVGNFDGVHIGHQALLRSMRAKAEMLGTVPTVLTFYPHPVEVLQPNKKLERLTTTAEKLALLEQIGVEFALVLPFTKELAELAPEEFFKVYLAEGLAAKSVHVGSGFRFGKNRQGTTELLASLCQSRGIDAEGLAPVLRDSERVSSSIIRTHVLNGEVEKAAAGLARPYSVTGQVVPGDARGRQIGFRTANLACPSEKILPKNGVYSARAKWQQQSFAAVVNIGVRPTFGPDSAPSPHVEAHFLDFDATIYEEFVELSFLNRLRDEKKFSSVDELKAQIHKDILAARAAR